MPLTCANVWWAPSGSNRRPADQKGEPTPLRMPNFLAPQGLRILYSPPDSIICRVYPAKIRPSPPVIPNFGRHSDERILLRARGLSRESPPVRASCCRASVLAPEPGPRLKRGRRGRRGRWPLAGAHLHEWRLTPASPGRRSEPAPFSAAIALTTPRHSLASAIGDRHSAQRDAVVTTRSCQCEDVRFVAGLRSALGRPPWTAELKRTVWPGTAGRATARRPKRGTAPPR